MKRSPTTSSTGGPSRTTWVSQSALGRSIAQPPLPADHGMQGLDESMRPLQPLRVPAGARRSGGLARGPARHHSCAPRSSGSPQAMALIRIFAVLALVLAGGLAAVAAAAAPLEAYGKLPSIETA